MAIRKEKQILSEVFYIQGQMMAYEDLTYGAYDEAEQLARKAFELYENGQINQAISAIGGAIDLNPMNASWHFDKALALDSMGRFEDAISEYETALSFNASDLEILNCLAVDYTRVGLYDLAISTFEYIESLDCEFEPSYCNRIIAYTEMNQHDMAEQMFYLAQQIKPDCALCYYNIGNSLYVRGEYEKAIGCWKRTAELEEKHPQINYRIAQAYWALGDMINAKEHFLYELRRNAGDIDVIFDFGLFELETNNLESAKEKFNRILELKPDFAPAFFYLGELAFNNKDYDKAKELYHKSLEEDTTLLGPRYRLALCHLEEGNEASALTNLVAELQLSPEHPEVLVSMGSVFLKLGELDYAVNCMLNAIDMGPDNASAAYYLGCINLMKGETGDAAFFFSKALGVEPEHAKALKQLAYLDIKAGRLDAAEEKIRKAESISPADVEIKRLMRALTVASTTGRVADFFGGLKKRAQKTIH